MVSDGQVQKQFWSVERFVAFVLAPIATPVSGVAALWLSRHFPGVHVTGQAAYAFAATTAGGVAAALIKWLDGRQKFVAQVASLEGHATGLLNSPTATAVLAPAERKDLLDHLATLIETEVGKLGASLGRGAPSATITNKPLTTVGNTIAPSPVVPMTTAPPPPPPPDPALEPTNWPTAPGAPATPTATA